MRKNLWYPFLITESQVRDYFQRFLIGNENIPLDAISKVKIDQVEPLFRLFALCRGEYHAHWTADCFWEREEEYTEYKSETVFVDNHGREYSSKVDGATPVSKMVPVKKSRTVVDKTQRVDEEETKSWVAYMDAEGKNSPFNEWAIKQYLDAYKRSEGGGVGAEFRSMSDMENLDPNMPHPAFPNQKINEEAVVSSVASNLKDTIRRSKELELPGNRHKNFSFLLVPDLHIDYEEYLPFYKVTYTYEKKQYDVWFFGQGTGEYFCEKYPESSESIPKLESAKKSSQSSMFAGLVGVPLVFLIGYLKHIEVFPVMLVFAVFCTAVFLSSLVKYIYVKKEIENISSLKIRLSAITSQANKSSDEKRAEMISLIGKEYATDNDKKAKSNKILRVAIYGIAIGVAGFLLVPSMVEARTESRAEKVAEERRQAEMQALVGTWVRSNVPAGSIMEEQFTFRKNGEYYSTKDVDMGEKYGGISTFLGEGTYWISFPTDPTTNREDYNANTLFLWIGSKYSDDDDEPFGRSYTISEDGGTLTWGERIFVREK